MKNWKTTLAGALAAAAELFGKGQPINKASVLTASALFLFGLVSKDHDVTGGTVDQTVTPTPSIHQ